ncbi:MAG: hypothetical protein ACI8WB_005054 [Phenylobacterium sp.]|jgi:hypothetical protein
MKWVPETIELLGNLPDGRFYTLITVVLVVAAVFAIKYLKHKKGQK